jgi:hypothetical protein
LPHPGQQLRPAHSRHPLIGQHQRHISPRRLQLRQPGQRRLADEPDTTW